MSNSPTDCPHPETRMLDGVKICLLCGVAIHEPVTNEIYDSTEPDRKIRLLVVEPGEVIDPIRCQITMVNLNDNPEYEALSYTWATQDGDATFSGRLFCNNDSVIRVTANCEAAIRRLRKPSLRRHIWVDAVCIDQNDLEGRNQQVSLVEHIYKGASRVLVYLDSPYEDFSELITWMKDNTLFDCREAQELDEAVSVPSTPPNMSYVFMASRLLSLRWFSRIWAVQEVTVARAVRIFVNDSEMDLSLKCVRCLQWLSTWNPISQGALPAPLRWIPRSKEPADLLSYLRASQYCFASDPRDKIFAIRGLLEEHDQSLIPVDYSASIETVYAIAAAAVIAQQGSLQILSSATGPFKDPFRDPSGQSTVNMKANVSHVSTWPSWVPDWRTPRESELFQLVETSSHPWNPRVHLISKPTCSVHPPQGYSSSRVNFYIATGPTKSLVPCLSVRAHSLDRVLEGMVGADKSTKSYTNQLRAYWTRESDTMEKGLFPNKETGQPRRLGPSIHLRSGLRIPRRYGPESQSLSELEPYKSFLLALERADDVHNVFSTSHSIGFAMYSARTYVKGDAVYALDGARKPFILREIAENKYRIVCDCYILGALDYFTPKATGGWGPWGELTEALRDEQRTATIVIC